jgi:hypothetical protein
MLLPFCTLSQPQTWPPGSKSQVYEPLCPHSGYQQRQGEGLPTDLAGNGTRRWRKAQADALLDLQLGTVEEHWTAQQSCHGTRGCTCVVYSRDTFA